MNKRHISLKDLATELGVSISTVSRALKNHPDISTELKQKVQELARKWNFTPNPLAMGLLRQETKMIGVIVPDINTHFYSSVISGIEKIAKQKGYFILIASSNESISKEKEAVENFLKARVEGLIVCISQETSNFEHFENLIANNIPLVFFDRICESLEVPSVLADGQDAAKKIIQHFYHNGCKRIAYISGPQHLNISQNREKGYLEGLSICGLDFDPGLLINCRLDFEEAKAATKTLLQLKNPPDAIFGINDTVAFAAMIEVKNHGLKIPRDISIAGFTDEFHSVVVDPPLTSVSHPTLQMGEEAANLFFESLQQNVAHQKIILPIELVVRASTLKKQ